MKHLTTKLLHLGRLPSYPKYYTRLNRVTRDIHTSLFVQSARD
jgi:hypothetical protein